MKKVFLTAVAVVTLGSLPSNAEVSVFDTDYCTDRAFDAVERYYENGGTDGFEAGAIFQLVENLCRFNFI